MTSSYDINDATRMSPAFDLFVCGLCQFVVQPFPRECPGCNSLYCDPCIKMQRSWSCSVNNCRSRMQPVELHRQVKEILETLSFTCPGCSERKRYTAFFEHVKQCNKISADDCVSQEQVQKIVAQNQNAVPVIHHAFSNLSRYIYVLEKDTKTVLQYDRQTNRVGRQKLNYRVNNIEVALPHNYQCV